MAIIALKAWYLAEYEPLEALEQRPHDLRLSKNSLLKSALRADFLDDAAEVRQTAWFQRYLEGEAVEFYIEGSGGYGIANIDLISHEIYFTKREVMAQLEPTIFLCYQTEHSDSSDWLRQTLEDAIAQINRRSRLPLTLEESNRLSDGPTKLNSTLMRKLRRSLLVVADGTAITQIPGAPPLLMPDPRVCVEVGYALQCKRPEQLLVAQQIRDDMPGHFPFDLPNRNRLVFHHQGDLNKMLPPLLTEHLQRFNLL